MILIPCTVLAAEKIVSYYNINIKKTGNYSYDLGLRKDSDYNANTKFHTNVKINFNTDLSGYDIETDGSNYKLSYAGNDNLKDKNILYNFASKILISRLITEKDTGTKINILFDNKTTKIASKNSLREYIIAYIVYEENLDVEINFEYKDSDAKDAFIIQAADYVANALYSKYEYKKDIYANLFSHKINITQHFPYKTFGT